MVETMQTNEGEKPHGSDEEEEEDQDHEGSEDGENMNKTLGDTTSKLGGEVEERFVISTFDRVMRTRDRYLVNPVKHPGYQIEDVKKTVIQKTLLLSAMLKKKLPFYVRSTVITFITILVYHRDFAAKLKRERIFKVTDFGWQLCMKFDLNNLEGALEDVPMSRDTDPYSSKVQEKIKIRDVDVNFEVLQYNQEYGFEYLGS